MKPFLARRFHVGHAGYLFYRLPDSGQDHRQGIPVTRIDELLQQRSAIDAELMQLRDAAAQELEQAQQRLQAVNVALGAPIKAQPKKLEPIDETDAGMGVREAKEQFDDAQSFTDELAELRARTQARRRR